MSFCTVPARRAGSAPCCSARPTYIASSHVAVALIVIDVFISSSGMPSNRVRISPRCGTGTPTLPTSPRASGWSGSYPVWVGRSNATDRPVWPRDRLVRYSSFDARADEWPEYVRISQGLSRVAMSLVSHPPRADRSAAPDRGHGHRRSLGGKEVQDELVHEIGLLHRHQVRCARDNRELRIRDRVVQLDRVLE